MAGPTCIVHHHLLLLSSLLLTLTLLFTPTRGQSDVAFRSYAVYSRVGSKLYAVGGGFSEEVINPKINGAITTSNITVGDGQTIVLDLSVSWDAAKPAWKRLRNGPRQMDFAGTLNADGSKFITFRSGANSSYAMVYDVASDTWSSLAGVTVVQPDRLGISAVTDPNTNKVYLPFGDQLQIFDFNTNTMTNMSMPNNPLSLTMYMEGVWWSKKQSILYFGGFTYPGGTQTPAPNFIYVYTPSTNTWAIPSTSGPAPSSRANMCVVISDDGNTLIVFGGRVIPGTGSQIISPELYKLDLNNMTWTRGADYTSPRIYSVCTLYNGTFFSWGGTDDKQNVDAPMIIYDVKRNLYLNKYSISPEDEVDAGPKDRETTTTTSDSDSLSIGAFVGIFFAAALSTAFVVWVVRYTLQKRNKNGGAGDDGASGYDETPGGKEVITRSNSYSQQHNYTGYNQYVPPNSHTPHMTVPRNAPQEHGNTPPPGFVMVSTVRGPEATPTAVEYRVDP